MLASSLTGFSGLLSSCTLGKRLDIKRVECAHTQWTVLPGESHTRVKVSIHLGAPLHGKRISTNDKELRDGLRVGGRKWREGGKDEGKKPER